MALYKQQRKDNERRLKQEIKEANTKSKELKKETKSLGIEQRLRAEEKDFKKSAKKHARKTAQAKTAQGAIGFEKLFSDGVMEVRPGFYSQTFRFQDVGYQTARDEDQKKIFNRYCELLNYVDTDMHLQLNLINQPIPRDVFNALVSLPDNDSDLAPYVHEYNAMLADKSSKQSHTIDQQRYFTVSVAENEPARAFSSLDTAVSKIREQLSNCEDCQSEVLSGMERGALIATQTIPDEVFQFSYEDAYFTGTTMKDAVTPSSFDFKPNGSTKYFKFGNKFGEILFIKDYPSDMNDRFMTELLELPLPMNISIHFTPMDQGEAIDLVRRKLLFMDKQRASEAKTAVKSGLDPSFVSSELLNDMDEATDLLAKVRNGNQRLFFMSFLIFVWADDYEQLDNAVFNITGVARKANVKLASLDLRQRQGFNSCLPLGCDFSDILRTMTTSESAIFGPFSATELFHPGGIYVGQNSVTNNMIILDRKQLSAPMGWVLGKPGYGKSFAVKNEIFARYASNPDDEFLIVDPAGEYGFSVEAFGGQENVIDPSLAPSKASYINPFDISLTYAGDDANPVILKSSFILTMINSAVGGESGLSDDEKSLIDRIVRTLYEEYDGTWTAEQMPTFVDFFDELEKETGKTARSLRNRLEIYVKGSLNVFAHHTNITADARIRSYNTKALPPAMRTLGMLVVLDQIRNRAAYNYSRGVRTWLYIDEAQNFFESPESIEYFDKTFSEGRKQLIVPTAITQNADRIIGHPQARQMLSNSDYMLIMHQAKADLSHLVGCLNLSGKECDFLDKAKPGEGLLIAGKRRITFKNEFPKETKLYELFSTDPNEREAALREKRFAALRERMGGEREGVGNACEDAETDVDAETNADMESDAESGTGMGSESQTGVEMDAGLDAEADTEAETDIGPRTETRPRTGYDTETKARDGRDDASFSHPNGFKSRVLDDMIARYGGEE